MTGIALSEVLRPVSGRAGADQSARVYSVTKHRGFVPSDEYFSKQVFSKDLSTYKVVMPGQFAYATIHLDEGSIGYAPEACLVSPMYTVFDVDRSRVDIDYLYRLLKSPQMLSSYSTIGRGSAERRRSISLEALGRIEVFLPPLPEQRRIASILDQVEFARSRCGTATGALEEVVSSVFDGIFGQYRVDSPECSPLVDFVDPARPLTYGILMPGDHIENGVPYIRVTDIKGGVVAESKLRRTTSEISSAYARSVLAGGDLLMSIRGHVGRTAVVPPVLQGANITQDTARIALTTLDPVFLQGWIATDQVANWMRQRTKGVAVKGLNLTDVKLIPIPPVTQLDQAQYRSVHDKVQEVKRAMRARQGALDELFVSLQHRAFTGQL